MHMKRRLSYNSPVVLSFVLLSLAALLMNEASGGLTNSYFFITYHSSLADPLTYVRFFTHVLGHSGWTHYSNNMLYILLLGPMLEEKYKSYKLVEVIAVTALATALVNYFFFPHVALCGASGVVFAFMLLSSFTSFNKNEIPVTFVLVAVIFLGQQVVDGILLSDNISNLSHIIGGLVGAGFGFALSRKSRR